MKKVIKKILKSRIKRDDDFKDKKIVLSKRSYKYFEYLGNKLFKKLLSTSISNRINSSDKEIVVDQQDLLASISLLIPFGKFLEYCTFSVAGDKEKEREKEREREREKRELELKQTTTTTTKKKKVEKQQKVEKVEKVEKEKVVDEKEATDEKVEKKAGEKTSTNQKVVEEKVEEKKETNQKVVEEKVDKEKVEEKAGEKVVDEKSERVDKEKVDKKKIDKDKKETEEREGEKKKIQEEEEEDKLLISELYIKKLIKSQYYQGEYKFTKCFIKSISSLLNYILVELMDCCLNHIFSINKRKNIIDLEDLLLTINQDDDLRIVMKKLTNRIFEDRLDNREYLIDINKSLKGNQKIFNKEAIYNDLQKNFKLLESSRTNKPLSINSKLSDDNKTIEKTKYTLNKGKVLVKTSKKSVKPIVEGTTIIANKKRERELVKEEEYTQEYLQTLKVEDLKDIAKPIGVKYGGNKASIIQRLLEYFSGDKEIHSKIITNVIKKVSKKSGVSFLPQSHLVKVEVLKETKQIIQPNKDSIYFELENLDNQIDSNNDEDNDNIHSDDSFIHESYSDAEDESEIDQRDEKLDDKVKDIYNYDFNKYYRDQLDSLKVGGSNTTTGTSTGADENSNSIKYKRLLKKSPRWVWKFSSKLEFDNSIDQYKLPPLSDDEKLELMEDDDDQDIDDENDENTKNVKDSDKEYESESESEDD